MIGIAAHAQAVYLERDVLAEDVAQRDVESRLALVHGLRARCRQAWAQRNARRSLTKPASRMRTRTCHTDASASRCSCVSRDDSVPTVAGWLPCGRAARDVLAAAAASPRPGPGRAPPARPATSSSGRPLFQASASPPHSASRSMSSSWSSSSPPPLPAMLGTPPSGATAMAPDRRMANASSSSLDCSQEGAAPGTAAAAPAGASSPSASASCGGLQPARELCQCRSGSESHHSAGARLAPDKEADRRAATLEHKRVDLRQRSHRELWRRRRGTSARPTSRWDMPTSANPLKIMTSCPAAADPTALLSSGESRTAYPPRRWPAPLTSTRSADRPL